MNRVVSGLGRLATFGVGGMRVAAGAARGDDARAVVVSCDVFATLIARHADDDAARRAGTLAFARLVRARGLSLADDVMMLRCRVESAIGLERRAAGLDPDFTHAELFTRMALASGVVDPLVLGLAAAEEEADWERRLTRPVAALHDWYLAAVEAGQRVIAISDTRYSELELGAILTGHGYDRLAHVYCSAEHAANKFSGKLFNVVAHAEGAKLHEISHRGDSLPADVLTPAALGIGVTRIKPPPPPPAAAPLPVPSPAVHSDDPSAQAHTVGATIFGPVFAAFVRLMLAQAYADGITHLAFLARDGELPMLITQILAKTLPETWRPRISYVYVSKRGIEGSLDEQGELTDHGRRVLRYLDAAGVLDVHTAIVDIGWRGSIYDSIRKLAEKAGAGLPAIYYLGLWNEDYLPAADDRVRGILCDQRRNRRPREGAAWFAAMLLEGVARAEHGTVIGYTDRADGTVEPTLAQAGGMRQAEIAATKTQREIRRGVLDHTRALARMDGIAAPPDADRTRAAAQRILFRLAFFPDSISRKLGQQLVYSDSTDDFIASLVQARGEGLAGRLRPLRSPWKGAGFVEVGSWLGGLVYLLIETAFCYVPLGLKTRLRNRMGPPPNDADKQGS